ncbi:MAG: hypothetical protein R6W94_13105 [Spirochaetia bacterium]
MTRRYILRPHRLLCLAALFALATTGWVTAQENAAQQNPRLTYVEDAVEVVREHRTLQPRLLFGAPLEPFDFIATGADGLAEMRLGATGTEATGTEATGTEATGTEAPAEAAVTLLRLDPDSALMLHTHSPLVVELLHGSLSVETGAAGEITLLLREGRLEATDAAVSVGRGAFGRLRVEAINGRATVFVDEAEPPRLFAREDRSVLLSPDRRAFENTRPTGDLGQWRGARLMVAAMASAGETHATILERSRLYTLAKAEYDTAYADAVRAEPSILGWMRSADVERSLTDATAAEIEAPLAALEEARREFEPLYRELEALVPVVGADIVPASVSEDSRIIEERLHTTRHLLRLFFESQGRLPGSDPDAAVVPGSDPDVVPEPERGM